MAPDNNSHTQQYKSGESPVLRTSLGYIYLILSQLGLQSEILFQTTEVTVTQWWTGS